MALSKPPLDITEQAFQRDYVIPLAKSYGWRVHVNLVRHRAGSLRADPDWPDLTLVSMRVDLNEIIFAELKAHGKSLTPGQVRTLELLKTIEPAQRHIRVFIWEPADWEHIVEWLAR
jgi:hypothetical protein